MRSASAWRCSVETLGVSRSAAVSSALTRVGAYRGTICGIDRADYLLRRIRGEAEPLHAEAAAVHGQMCDIARKRAVTATASAA